MPSRLGSAIERIRATRKLVNDAREVLLRESCLTLEQLEKLQTSAKRWCGKTSLQMGIC